MRFYGQRAFTLIELLVVVAIIGLISSAALVFVKDTADIKAHAYTKRVMASVKAGIADTDEDGYFSGFVNDFGTLPPHLSFMTDTEGEDRNFTIVRDFAAADTMSRSHRFTNMGKQNGTRFPAPFMTDCSAGGDRCEENASADLTAITKVIYAGYHGGYLADGDTARDGWNTPVGMQSDLNISAENSGSRDGEHFLNLRSAGSDRQFRDESKRLVRSEFDLASEAGSSEALYADDYNQTYDRHRFTVDSLDIDLTLSREVNGSDVDKTAVLIYSPMLYYVEDSGSQICSEYNTTHAECPTGDATYKPYIPYSIHNTFPDQIGHLIEQNLSWHIGLIKYQLYFDENNESRLYINRGGIRSDIDDALAYDFNQSNSMDDLNLTASRFFDDFRVRYLKADGSVQDKGWAFSSAPVDDANPFYLFAGTKVVSVWYRKRNESTWYEDDTFTVDFKPGRRQKIELECR